MESADCLQEIEQLFREQALDGAYPEKAALSLPVAVELPGGKIADAVFAYEEVSGRGRPFAWGKLDPASQKPLLYARCEVWDFAFPSSPAPGEALELTPCQPLSEEERADTLQELRELYEGLRGFAFAPSPAPGQQELMDYYAVLFDMLVWQEHRSFYQALAGPFLKWLGIDWGEEPQPKPEDASGEDLAAAVRELSALFVRKIETDRHKEKLFDRMHQELQEYKNDLLDSLTRSMEGDIIKLIDDIEKTMELYRSRQFTADNFRRFLTLFEGVGTDLTDLLYRHGLEPFHQEGDEVVVGRQKILATLPTEKKSQDKKVAVRHAKGWEKNGKVIRPERISAYLYTPPQESGTGDET